MDMSNETYMLHQTPPTLAALLVNTLPLDPSDILYEPFKGEGAFYNAFPTHNEKDWAEIRQGRDYKDHTAAYDWVITNPPFSIHNGKKLVNSFWPLLDYFSQHARKGIAFLANDRCFSTFTPLRLELLKQRGWALTALTTCNVKKWRGRYYFVVFQKARSSVIAHLSGSF